MKRLFVWIKFKDKFLMLYVLIPVVIAALNALQIEAVFEPATEMLTTIPMLIYLFLARCF